MVDLSIESSGTNSEDFDHLDFDLVQGHAGRNAWVDCKRSLANGRF
jgi:hypothetical protein